MSWLQITLQALFITKRNEGDTTLYFVSVRYICLLVPACLRLCVMQNVQDSMDDIVDKE